MGAAEDRALFDRLNAEQARLYLANGRVVDEHQQAIHDRMASIAPRGYESLGHPSRKSMPQSLATLHAAKGSR